MSSTSGPPPNHFSPKAHRERHPHRHPPPPLPGRRGRARVVAVLPCAFGIHAVPGQTTVGIAAAHGVQCVFAGQWQPAAVAGQQWFRGYRSTPGRRLQRRAIAPERSPSRSLQQRPGNQVVPGLFHCRFLSFPPFRSARAAPKGIDPPGTQFFNNLLQAVCSTGATASLPIESGEGSVERTLVSSLHFGCAFAFTAGSGRMRGPAGCAGIDHPVQRRACAAPLRGRGRVKTQPKWRCAPAGAPVASWFFSTRVAQLAEHRPPNPTVEGSTPSARANPFPWPWPGMPQQPCRMGRLVFLGPGIAGSTPVCGSLFPLC